MIELLTAAAIAVCPPQGKRHHCVHDGDTIWWNGEKMRLADIDTPELNGQCPYERALAKQARDRLVELLNTHSIHIERVGADRYGRTLVRLPVVSQALVREGLAREWSGRREGWC